MEMDARTVAQVDELERLRSLYERDRLRGDVVYRALRDAIMQGILPEGHRLQDRALASVMHVSRTPVREAIQRLESEGFVETTPRQGTLVATMTHQDIEDIYAIRIALEGLAARLAAQRASSAEVDVLVHLNDEYAAAVSRNDFPATTALNRQWHEALYQATRNARLRVLLGTMHDAVQRFGQSTLSVPLRAEASVEEHRAIIDAIRSRDADLAENLARAHKEKAKAVRLSIYQQAQLTPRPV